MYKLFYNLHRASEHEDEDEEESSEEDWIKEWKKAKASTPKKKNVDEVFDESSSARKRRQLLKSGPFKGTAGAAKGQQKVKKVVFERKSDEEFDKDEIEKAKRESILSLIYLV